MMSPPSPATAGRTRVSISSLIVSTRLGVVGVEELVRRRGVAPPVSDQRRAGEEEFGDDAEHGGAQMLPLALGSW